VIPVATETHDTPEAPAKETKEQEELLLRWLSALGGGGIVVMMIAASVGVINPDVDSGLIGLVVLVGAAALLMAIGAWTIVVQPHKNFDDINQPLYGGHQHVEESPLQEERTKEDIEHVPGDKEILDSPGEVDVSEPGPVDQDIDDELTSNP
jgi:ABC-type nickel/cobalt efflux system permease component RcnA